MIPFNSFIHGRKEEEFEYHMLEEVARKEECSSGMLYELGGVQNGRVGGRRMSLCDVCWRRWPGRKSCLITSLLNELGGVQSSRVGERRRNLCPVC